jgi:hypothetical protein
VVFLGMRRLLLTSFLGYIYAVAAILFARGPRHPLSRSTPIGFLLVLAACSRSECARACGRCDQSAALYPDQKTHRMGVLHAWWPGA